MKRELAKDRELSFSIRDLMDSRTRIWMLSHSGHVAWEKMSEVGKSRRMSCASVRGVTVDVRCRLQLR